MGSTPRRQKRPSRPRAQQIITDHPATDANEALATEVTPLVRDDFASAFGEAFLYMPDEEPLESAAAPIAPTEPTPLVENAEAATEPTPPVEGTATTPAPKKPRRSRAKRTPAVPDADAPISEAPVAESAAEPVESTAATLPLEAPAKTAKRGDRRKKTSDASDTVAKPRRRKTDVAAALPPVVPEVLETVLPPSAELLPAAPESFAAAPVDPVVEELPTPAPEAWVDLVLEPTPSTKTTDEWVDQVLEPAKIPLPRPRPVAARAAKPNAKPVAKAAAKAPAAARRASAPAAKGGSASANTVAETRWWIVAVAMILVVIVAIANRPSRGHAPLPPGVMGVWTTNFWKYDHQTLELLPDTVVLTLDAMEEGRFPITKVETMDAGQETAVTVSYRVGSGEERVLDFLADQDPTTALRFRAHSGLVWVRPTP